MSALESDPDVIAISASDDLFRRGIDLYRARDDKNWSMTDCLSFLVMRELEISEALTADHHFAQAGFRTLLSGR